MFQLGFDYNYVQLGYVMMIKWFLDEEENKLLEYVNQFLGMVLLVSLCKIVILYILFFFILLICIEVIEYVIIYGYRYIYLVCVILYLYGSQFVCKLYIYQIYMCIYI